jgi:hypothetical protein
LKGAVVALQQQIFSTFLSVIPADPTPEQVAQNSGNIAVILQGSANWDSSKKSDIASFVGKFATGIYHGKVKE